MKFTSRLLSLSLVLVAIPAFAAPFDLDDLLSNLKDKDGNAASAKSLPKTYIREAGEGPDITATKLDSAVGMDAKTTIPFGFTIKFPGGFLALCEPGKLNKDGTDCATNKDRSDIIEFVVGSTDLLFYSDPATENVDLSMDKYCCERVFMEQGMLVDGRANAAAPKAVGVPDLSVYIRDGTRPRVFIIGSDTPERKEVPEPGTLYLLGTGLAGLLGYGWHRRRQA